MFKNVALLFAGLLILLSLSGQCPDRDFLWHRINFLRDSSQVSSASQLAELKTYLDNINGCPYINDSTHSLLLSRIGWLYSMQNDYKSAISFSNRAIDMIHSHIRQKNINESQLIKCYNNLRILYDSTGQGIAKNRSIDSCISLVVRLKTGYAYAVELVNSKIEHYFEKGDYYNCISYATLGELIAEKAGYLDEIVYYYLTWKINSLIYLNQYSEASALLEIYIRKCYEPKSKKFLGSLLGLKALLADETGNSRDAIKFSSQSVFYNKLYSNYSACAAVLSNLGFNLYLKKLRQYDKALKYFNESLTYSKDDYAVEALDNIAITYVKKNDFRNAFKSFRKAFDKIYPGADEGNILTKSGEEILNSVSAEFVVNLFLNKAETYLLRYKQNKGLGDLQEALLVYKSADRLMDKIRTAQTDYASKLFWRSDIRRLYEQAIESCYLSGNPNDAFYFFEKSKAVLLNDQLREQATGDSNVFEVALLKRKIRDIEKQADTMDNSSKEFGDLQREIFINTEQLTHLDQLIKNNNPFYHQSLIDTNFISLKSVMDSIKQHKYAQAILEFFDGDSAIYTLTITAEKSKIIRINKKEFENKADHYSAYLSDPVSENKEYNDFVRSGHELYDLLFKEASLPEGRIIVSPDGRYFPLEALITNTNYAAPEYFIKGHIISYAYSVRFLLNDFNKKGILPTGNFLGLAPVQYPASFHLTSLHQSDVSLRNISSHFRKSLNLTFSGASKHNFQQHFSGYRIIQLYSHSSDTSDHQEPVIYFSDSALYLSELIPDKQTAAQLIVLSACETGNGKLYKGEGVFSFNRGFAALGIPSSVINLWSVENEPTYKITELFYKYAAEGLPLDLALQKAKLEYIARSSKEKGLPYYWAAAILAGKTDAIEFNKGFSWSGVAIDLGIIFLCLSIIFSFRRRINKPFL